ncbi:MAG TPA: UDP-N-acetylmuramoyl-L-alanine--D-glutamate ligase [Acidimicrobiia bacterium]|nr:UDP-N-acetylmuramoyl-L-alanine--D-glutamate ligase [Acidimicrobiia bacterium]
MRTLVLGAGVSGRAAARLATRLRHRVVVYDREAVTDLGGVAVVAGSWDPLLLEGVDLVVASPGFGERSPAITDALEAGIEVIGEVEFAWRQLDVPTVAVTGTNGKTTVTALIADMLSASGVRAPALGNIGDPVSDWTADPPDVLVVEMSSFQLRFIDRFHCQVAVVTNVAADHLDWHASLAGYRAAKARIVENQGPDDLIVFDALDPGAAEVAARSAASGVGVAADGSATLGVVGGRLVWDGASVPLSSLQVEDPVFHTDLALAGVAALAMGASAEAVAGVAQAFVPSGHRRQLVHAARGVRWIDDSKATNPHAALASIAAYDSVVLVAGGLAKGLDVAPLATAPGVKHVVAIGESAPVLLAAAGERGHPAGSMEEACRIARTLAVEGDVVLLAPGCASFDMFDSYGARGDAFAAAARSEDS